MQNLIILLSLLPACYCIQSEVLQRKINEHGLDAILDDRFLILNGKLSTLREIYGDVELTATNFDIGDELASSILRYDELISSEPADFDRKCIGGSYIERELKFEPIENVAQAPFSPTTQDTPTEIAKKITDNIKLTLLKGESRAGKTVVISRVYQKLIEAQLHWSIYVDLARLFPNHLHANKVSLENIIKNAVEDKAQVLFKNVMELNPKKIVVLLDGVDEMHKERGDRLLPIIKNLLDKNVGVILTGNEYTIDYLKRGQMFPVVWEIPHMNLRETKQFLVNFWKAKALEEDPITQPDVNRLNEYVAVFLSLLEETPFLRQPAVLSVLGLKFATTENLTPYDETFESRYLPMGAINYAMDNNVRPTSLSRLRHAPLNKKIMYDKMYAALTRYRNDLDDPGLYYGATAFSNLVKALMKFITPLPYLPPTNLRPSTSFIPSGFLQSITRDISKSARILREYNEMAIFSYYKSDGSVDFLSEDFQYFFASQFLISLCDDDDDPKLDTMLLEIFRNENFSPIVEFINDHGDDIKMEFFNKIAIKINSFDKIFDNLLANKFEDLLIKFYQALLIADKGQELQLYFNNPLTRAAKERIFGILKLPQKSDAILNYENPLHATTRLELLVENNMLKVLRVISGSIHFDNAKQNYEKLLNIAVTKNRPYLDLFIFLKQNYIPSTFSIDYKTLLYNAINEAGELAIPIAKHLVTFIRSEELNTDSKLAHAIVRWNSHDLLRLFKEEWGQSFASSSKANDLSLLATAIDSSPSSLYSTPDFWKKISYLIENLPSLWTPFAINELPMINIDEYKIPMDDYRSKWLKVIIGANDIPSDVDAFANKINFNMVHPEDTLYQQYSAQILATPTQLWRLNPATLSLRRNFVLQHLQSQTSSQITLLEFLVNYKTAPLPVSEHLEYRKTIKFLIEKQKEYLDTESVNRIFTSAVRNIMSPNDVEDLAVLMIDSGLASKLTDDMKRNLVQLFHSNTRENTPRTNIVSMQNAFIYSINYNLKCVPSEEIEGVFQSLIIRPGDESPFVDERSSVLKCLEPSK